MVPLTAGLGAKNSRRPWGEAREQVLVKPKEGQTATGGWAMPVRPTLPDTYGVHRILH
jgi:hypothetical protein